MAALDANDGGQLRDKRRAESDEGGAVWSPVTAAP